MEKNYPNLTITKVSKFSLDFINTIFLIVFLGISSISLAQTNDCNINNNEIIGNTTCSPFSYTIPGKNFSNSNAPVGCNISSVVDGWFYFTTGSYTSSINITTTDNSSKPNHTTGIAIYTGSGTCNNLTPVACSYENNRTPALSSTVLPNTTYKLRIMRVGNNANKDMQGTICIIYNYTCPTTAGTLSGNQYICRYNPNNTTTFSSTVSGGTWSSSNTSVATVNATTGVVTAVNSGTATISYTVGGGSCPSFSTTRTVHIASGTTNPSNLVPTGTQCAGSTITYTINPDPYAISYTWTYTGNGATITQASDGLSASVAFSTSATSGNMVVYSTNGCGQNGQVSKNIQITPLPASTPVTTGVDIYNCTSAGLKWTSVTNAPGNYLDISTVSDFSTFVPGFESYPLNYQTNYTFNGNSGTTYYYRIRAYNNCQTTSYSNTTSFSLGSVPGTTSSNQTICSGNSPSNITLTGYSGAIQWQSSTNNIDFTNITGATSNTLTSSQIGTVTGTKYFKALVTYSYCSTVNSNTVVVNVIPGPSQPTTDTPINTTCNSFTAKWGTSTNATSYIIDVALDSNFIIPVSGYFNLNVGNNTNLTITGLNDNTTYYYRVKGKNSCTESNYSSAISQKTSMSPEKPTLVATEQPDCLSNTGTITLENLHVGGTLLQSGSSSNSIPITSSTMIISNLTPGTYNYAVNDGDCTSSALQNITLIAATSNTWNGSNWSNGTPTMSQEIIFNANYSSTSNIDACSCVVNSGVSVIINSGNTLKIKNSLNVQNTGNLTFENNASLVQINNIANTGQVTYKRNATVKKYDYVYWSSPVIDFNMNGIPASARYAWNPTAPNANDGQGNWYAASGNMATGTGYIFRVPNSTPTTSTPDNLTTMFTGVPFNGTKNITVSRGDDFTGNGTLGTPRTISDDNWNLIGNPYPSAIDVNEFLEANTAIEGFVYVWTHGNSPLSGNYQNPFYQNYTYNYNPNDYIQINKTGSTAGSSDYSIATGQGFFVLMKPGPAGSSTVTFNNAMRNASLSNSTFYKTANSNNIDTNTPGRIWLELISSTAVSRTLIGYIEGATNDKDRMYDAFTENKGEQNLYSTIDNESFSIQGKSLPFNDTDVVSLGINIINNGLHSIAISEVDGLFLGAQDIYLKDELLNIYHDLKSAPYTFTATAGVHNDRFKLVYKSATVLSNQTFNENEIQIAKNNNIINIVSGNETMDNVKVFDTRGRLIVERTKINNNIISIDVNTAQDQVLILNITTTEGIKITRKIL